MNSERNFQLFRNEPALGSLIDPNDVPIEYRMFNADYASVEPWLKRALEKERRYGDPASAVFVATAEGAAKAASLLPGTYTVVTTNVPYLSGGKQNEIMKKFSDKH